MLSRLSPKQTAAPPPFFSASPTLQAPATEHVQSPHAFAWLRHADNAKTPKKFNRQPIRQADTVGNNSLLLLEVWKNKKCLLLQKGWIVKLSRKVLFSLSKKTYFSVSLFPCRNYKYLGGSVYALILKPRTGSSGIWSSLSWNKVYLHVFAKFESCVCVSSTSTSMCTQLQRNQWVGVQPLFAITNHVQNVAKTWVSLPGQLGFTHDVTAATAFQIWKISPRNQRLSKVTLNHWYIDEIIPGPSRLRFSEACILRFWGHQHTQFCLLICRNSRTQMQEEWQPAPQPLKPSPHLAWIWIPQLRNITKRQKEFHIGRKWRTLWIEEILSSSWRLSCGAIVKNSLTLLKYLKLLPERQGPDPGSSCRKLVSEHPIPVCSLKSS